MIITDILSHHANKHGTNQMRYLLCNRSDQLVVDFVFVLDQQTDDWLRTDDDVVKLAGMHLCRVATTFHVLTLKLQHSIVDLRV